MKKRITIKTLIAGFGMLALFSCQQVPQVASNGDYVDNTPTDNSIKLCSDGTLNCYVTVTNTTTIQPVDDMDFNQNYEECVQQCLPTTTCTTTNINEAASICPDAYKTCDSQCKVVSEDGPYGNLPQSDPIALPDNPKVVIVDITGCYDEQSPYEIHFKGPNVSFHTPIEDKREIISIGTGFGITVSKGTAKIGYGVGRSPCYDSRELRNVADVKFTPIGESTIKVGTQNVAVVPFSSTEAISKKYAMPHSMSFGIPSQIRDEVDLSQVTWMLKEVPEASPTMGKNSIWGFRFYNNDVPFGESVVFLDYTVKFLGSPATKQKVTMYLFMKSKE